MCSYAEFPLALMSLALAFSLALWPWPWPWPFGLLAFWPFGLLAFWPFGLGLGVVLVLLNLLRCFLGATDDAHTAVGLASG